MKAQTLRRVAAADRVRRGRPEERGPSTRGVRGVALVIVLGFIVLCTVLVVAFFASVSTEAVSARAAASENSAAQLAGSAVQLVEGTISYATEPRADTTFAWACQPGMIRTYGTGSSASADPLAYYKLYSSDNMIVSGKAACNAYTTTPGSDVPSNWNLLPSLYADLNAPLIKQIPNGTPTPASAVIFPIVDPRAADLGVEGFATSASAATLPGFSPVTGAATSSTAADPTKFAADSAARLPMPVRWLYVLRDGTMAVPSSGDATSATFGGSSVPTATNPIVGRVAFWTDDEDAKVNVNTASEGTYADMPVANAGAPGTAFVYPQATPVADILLAVNQGAQHEYQRYPGHPATTCLSSVFGVPLALLGSAGTTGLRASVVKTITDAIPRVSDYPTVTSGSGMSSMGGTQDPAPSPYPVPPAPTPIPLTPDLDRLYASLDEFEFLAPSQNAVQPRPQQTLGDAGTTEQNLVDTCRFFLTAHSKAPELNLYGLPRVTMWPTWDKTSLPAGKSNTSFDEEIVRCSTIAAAATGKTHPMSFTRYDPKSATNDFSSARNQQVFGYLQTLMGRAVPGFGGSFLTKYGSSDLSQMLTEVFDYIRCTNLADQSDGTLNHSYTPSILPGGTSNNVAVGQVVPTQNGGSRGFGRIATVAELALVLTKVDDRNDISQGEGLISYTDPATKKTANVPNLVKTLSYTGDSGPGSTDPTQKTLLEWSLVPKCFSPMAGYAGLGNDFRFRFAVTNLKIGDAPVINGALGTYADLFDTGRLPNGGRDAVLGGLMGFSFLVNIGSGSPATSLFPTGLCAVTGTNASVAYAVNNGASGGTIPVSGTVQVTVYSPNTSTNPIQTLIFEFPTTDQSGQTVANVPIPELTYGNGLTQPTGTFRQATYTGTYPQSAYNPTKTSLFAYSPTNSLHGGGTNTRVWNNNMDHMLTDSSGTPVAPNKASGTATVRSLVPTGTVPMKLSSGASAPIPIDGDLRYVAASQTVPKEAWQLAQKNVSSGTLGVAGGTPATTTDYEVTNLRFSNYYAVANGKEGALFPLVVPPGDTKPMGYGRPPEIPPGIASVAMAQSDGGVPGDWDNGPGCQVDGPYVNKPNEGESLNASGTGGIPYVGPGDVTSNYGAAASIYFSPNLQISSPVMLGSLPVGLDHPWRTLLFRPSTLSGYQSTYQHPGGADATVRDNLLLDLFWMPVVEPYGISEPFATSGKINLNTQIAPFTYITRTTGLRAVLKSVMLTALNPAQKPNTKDAHFISNYKNPYGTSTGMSQNASATTRYPLDLDQTIGQITSTLQNSTPPADSNPVNSYPEFARATYTAALPNFFVSASQVCDLPLIPVNYTPGTLSGFWSANAMTGDNSLERPYSLIYPRVTTKSNIFTVHVIAQSLKKITTDSSQNVWNENRDQITSEYRGAYTVEKYFDPNTDNLTDSNGNALDPNNDKAIDPTAGLRSTKWRLVSVKRFGQ